jgi:hypothetical protein
MRTIMTAAAALLASIAAALGRRIIAACPDRSQCQIDVPLSKRSSTITSITNVTKTK